MGFDYDRLPDGYYDKIFRRSSGMQSKWHHLKFARVRELLPPFDLHLDVGCGAGTFISTLRGPGRSIGVDISDRQIRYAWEHCRSQMHEFQTVDSGPLPFRRNTFDVVTALELMEHLTPEDGLRLMNEVHRVLKPQGCFILSTPNYGALAFPLEWLVGHLSEVSYADQHIKQYKKESLESLLRRCGFEIEVLEGHLLLAPFMAAVGWKFADRVARMEPSSLVKRVGHLLFAKGIKRCPREVTTAAPAHPAEGRMR